MSRSSRSQSLKTKRQRENGAVSSSYTQAATGKSWHVLVHEASGRIVKGSDLKKLKTSMFSNTENTRGLATRRSLQQLTVEADPPRPQPATPGSPPSVVQSVSKSPAGPCTNCGRIGMRLR
jgi:hypothetical protein